MQHEIRLSRVSKDRYRTKFTYATFLAIINSFFIKDEMFYFSLLNYLLSLPMSEQA